MQKLVEIDSPISDLYPITFETDADGKMEDWQGIVLLPPFQPGRVVKAVNASVKFSTQRAREYSEAIGKDLHNFIVREIP